MIHYPIGANASRALHIFYRSRFTAAPDRIIAEKLWKPLWQFNGKGTRQAKRLEWQPDRNYWLFLLTIRRKWDALCQEVICQEESQLFVEHFAKHSVNVLLDFDRILIDLLNGIYSIIF